MNEEMSIYRMPNMGCLVGSAYQKMVAQLVEELMKAGLSISVSEYLVLRALYTRDGMQQCEIGNLIGKDKSAICRTVSAMSKRGLVRTEPISHKCLRVWLTEESKSIKPKIMAVAENRQKALAELCSQEELEVFNIVLHKIINQKNK